jgi:acetyltransferase-like isoleucine patch superfamily enzyme
VSGPNLDSLRERLLFRARHSAREVFPALFRMAWLRFCGAEIGKNTFLPKVAITWPHQLQIGDNCVLEPDISFKFDGVWKAGPSIIIGDGVFICRGCEFNIRKRITVGDKCAIASGCKFVDHDHGIEGEQIDETPGLEAEITLGNHVWLGCNVVVLKGVTIGSSAVVGAGGVVTKNIPAGEIWAGVPARKLSSREEHSRAKLSCC